MLGPEGDTRDHNRQDRHDPRAGCHIGILPRTGGGDYLPGPGPTREATPKREGPADSSGTFSVIHWLLARRAHQRSHRSGAALPHRWTAQGSHNLNPRAPVGGGALGSGDGSVAHGVTAQGTRSYAPGEHRTRLRSGQSLRTARDPHTAGRGPTVHQPSHRRHPPHPRLRQTRHLVAHRTRRSRATPRPLRASRHGTAGATA